MSETKRKIESWLRKQEGRWEKISGNSETTTERLQVEGGWIYRTILRGSFGDDPSVAMCFVPIAHSDI